MTLVLPGLVNVYSLRHRKWPSRNSGFTELENGDFPVRYVKLPEGIPHIFFGDIDVKLQESGWSWRQGTQDFPQNAMFQPLAHWRVPSGNLT